MVVEATPEADEEVDVLDDEALLLELIPLTVELPARVRVVVRLPLETLLVLI